MSDLPNASSLINRVSTRMRVSALARAFYRAFLWIGGIYLLALLVSRLTGLLPQSWFPLESGLVVPGLALLLAAVFHKRPSVRDSAREIDIHSDSKDLFLTVSGLDKTAGKYQELVKRDAETRSEKIEPEKVVPYQVGKRVGPMLFTTAAVLLLTLFVPQLDPFGKVEAAEAKSKIADSLRQSKKATLQRAEQLKKDKEKQGEETLVQKELNKLKASLKKMKPGNVKKAEQSKVLIDKKKNLNALFNKKNKNSALREMLSKQISNQSFGGAQSEKQKEWLKDLKEGKTDKLLNEVSDIQQKMKELAEEKDPVEKAKKARELKKQLQQLADFANNKANSKQMAQALERAMQQMEAGEENQEISKEAMEAAMESLELSKEEMQNLAQAAQEMKKLEEALKAVQMARKLNEQGDLDGSEMEGMESIEDYAEMYERMMAENGGDGEGDGMGGEGQGRGDVADEDDSQKTGFKKEESKAQIQAGKNILSWKTKGLSEAGEFKKEIGASVRALKSGVSEAIKKEQVPPGYVDGIKKYFDNIEGGTKSEATDSAKSDASGDE